MEDFLSFDIVMGVYASNIEQIEVFPTIKEEETKVVEQVDGGHEATMNIMISGSSLPPVFCIHMRSGPIYWGGYLPCKKDYKVMVFYM